jgi:CheY-like chemotaxis protein
MLLRKLAVICDVVNDGEEAVQMFEKNPKKYDIMFMDNMMPNMSGIEATKRIRELGYGKIIVGLTGNTMETEMKDFENVGADVVLAKPIKTLQCEVILDHMNKYGSEATIKTRSLKKMMMKIST